MLDFNIFAENMQLNEAACNLWAGAWQQSQALFEEEKLYFLQEDFINEVCQISSLEAAASEVLQAAAKEILASPLLCRFAWHCHWRHNLLPESHLSYPGIFPSKDIKLPADNSHLFTLVLFARLPELKQFYKDRGIPEQILADTLYDLQIWTQNTFNKTGKYTFSAFAWMNNHFQPNIFALGRLQFQFRQWHNPIKVFRQQKTGTLRFFCKGNEKISVSGFRTAEADEEIAFTTFYQEANGQVSGNLVNNQGYVEKEIITIDLCEWEEFLSAGDPVLILHIPEGAPLIQEECKEAIKQAWEFFPKYFPEYKFKAITSNSWLFNPDLKKYLPQSNIIKFQELFQLFPAKNTTGKQTKERVFQKEDIAIEDAPENTSLQRIVKKHLMDGKFWHNGAVLLPKE